MPKKQESKTQTFETVEPIGKRVLIRKDEDKKQTKGGIQLPDNIEIPTITGRIVSVSAEVEISADLPLQQYDKVLFNPKGAIPVDFEGDNRLFVVEVENVVAVFRKTSPPRTRPAGSSLATHFWLIRVCLHNYDLFNLKTTHHSKKLVAPIARHARRI